MAKEQWSVASGQWPVVSGWWSVVGGQSLLVGGGWCPKGKAESEMPSAFCFTDHWPLATGHRSLATDPWPPTTALNYFPNITQSPCDVPMKSNSGSESQVLVREAMNA